MGYSHASRNLKDRHDIYSFIPKPMGYSIPVGEYGAGPNLSGYLRRAGWSSSCAPSYVLTHDSYRLAERSGSLSGFYSRAFSRGRDIYAGVRDYRPVTGYKPASSLEAKLFLN